MSDKEAAARAAEESVHEKSAGNGHQAPAPIPWRKGQLRNEVDASKCIWLAPNIALQIGYARQRLEGKVAGPDGALSGKEIQTRLVNAIPSIALFCNSAEFLRANQALLPPDLASQVRHITVTLDVCRMCPFHQRRQ